jgi:hypothetical protein
VIDLSHSPIPEQPTHPRQFQTLREVSVTLESILLEHDDNDLPDTSQLVDLANSWLGDPTTHRYILRSASTHEVSWIECVLPDILLIVLWGTEALRIGHIHNEFWFSNVTITCCPLTMAGEAFEITGVANLTAVLHPITESVEQQDE